MKKLAIIGGGAAGLAAAVAAGEALRTRGNTAPAVEVVLYEADDRVGRSVLATGNGRCNFSNACVEATHYRNATFVGEVLQVLQRQHATLAERGNANADASVNVDAGENANPRTNGEDPVHAFFANAGLEWREDDEGRLYPFTNKASTVLDVLRAACAAVGVREACGNAVDQVVPPQHEGERFHLRFADGAVEHAEAVIVACGGRRFEGLLPASYQTVAMQPVLGPLRTAGKLAKSLDNIRVRAALSLVGPDGAIKACEQGELLFRSYGVSGIAVFNLSRFACSSDTLLIDLLPFVPASDCESYLFRRRKRLAAQGGSLTGEAYVRGLLLPQVASVVLKQAKLRPEVMFGKSDVPALAAALKALPLKIEGIGEARQCQVTRGGLAVNNFDAATLESRWDKGLFVVGEALDVDAPCGGYNLHWAWASGLVAGRHAAARVRRGR